MNIYLQGLTMGLAYVAPIGLQNLFVINSALTQKRSRVYITALIVIFWDISLGVACFLGAGALMQALPWLQKVILGLGSLIVIYIGIGLLRSKASLEGGRDVNGALWICRHSGPTLSKYFYVLYQLINYLLHRSTTSKENFSHFEMRNIVEPAKTVTQK